MCRKKGLPRKRKILQEERSKRTRRTIVLGDNEGRKPTIFNNDVRKRIFIVLMKEQLKNYQKASKPGNRFFLGNPLSSGRVTYNNNKESYVGCFGINLKKH